MKTQDRWRAAARTVIENPKRASWALQDAFGLGRGDAWRAYRDLFADGYDTIGLPEGAEEVAIAYCLMAIVVEIEAAEAEEAAIMARARQRQEGWAR